MRHESLWKPLFVCSVLSLHFLLSSSTIAVDEVLFDGKSLQGWKGDLKYWRVENGAIVGEIPKGTSLNKNTWLVRQGPELGDFDLRLQFKLTGAPAANSGIQYRCQVENVDHVSGYQADLDMGATWLGRIYDEHGRALLVERGSRVSIDEAGKQQTEKFALPHQYAVLFRENAWNDYRIVAVGPHVCVYVNGTLFSEINDTQKGEADLVGSLAFQLHAGPETRIEFRDVRLERLAPNDTRIGEFVIKTPTPASTTQQEEGVVPSGADGKSLNLGFENGSLDHWTATGDAFQGQPVNQDGISKRWPDQTSNKNGDYFIGGYEKVFDGGAGSLTSIPFQVTYPYASCLFAGGEAPTTRVEIVLVGADGKDEKVIGTAVGQNREQMRRVAFDLKDYADRMIRVRLVDDNKGGWGHLNFDDFRFHKESPVPVEANTTARSTLNPVLQHLQKNPVEPSKDIVGSETTAQMYVPKGFSVDVIAAEPDLHQPMAFTFDAAGRLWVVEGYSYPQKRPAGEGLDRILILADNDGDGRFESRKVFAEKLNLVSGMEVGHGGVWIGAAPELLFIPDANGDDVPDSEPQVLLDGFGYADTHETLNSFMWGPDGWLYGTQGVFNTSKIGKPGSDDSQRVALSAGVWRYHPTRHVFEVFAHGGSNPWGLDFDDQGQIFMTHCRSFWGGGGTTHVMRGAHYWNQVNSGYASFISATGSSTLPSMRNYLLASARYDSGEGGAGKPGTGEVYGGHSHVGTMLYLGDNWPAEFRNHLFTHNLHGHQMNHQVNVREAGGYNTLHAGQDMLLCVDPQFIGVDLMYGPDGAVYMSDWYDPRHCHNPNIEHWDRGNGRIYRMKYDATYLPTQVYYPALGDDVLIAAQLHTNDWHVRTARMLLSERANAKKLEPETIAKLEKLAFEHADPSRRLRGLWALNAVGGLTAARYNRLLADKDEYVRSWAVQLASETLPPEESAAMIGIHAAKESSLLVRRSLASAIQRLPNQAAWKLAELLISQSENAEDRDLPGLIWFGLAPLIDKDINRGLNLVSKSKIQAISDNIQWYAAKISDAGRTDLAEKIRGGSGEIRVRELELLELALRGMRRVTAPPVWEKIAKNLYRSNSVVERQAAESIGAAFADKELFAAMRQTLSIAETKVDAKRHALSILANDTSPENQPLLLGLLGTEELVAQVLPLLRRYDAPAIADEVLARINQWKGPTNSAGIELLCSRPRWAEKLLESIEQGVVPKTSMTSFHARQMVSLGDEKLNARIAKDWGNVGPSSEKLRDEITKTGNAYKAAPLWAFNANDGAAHFQKLCATCHQAKPGTENIAPKLQGSGAKGIDYLIENVIDPNAVIGRDYQARMIKTNDGQVLTGIIVDENDSAISLRTQQNVVTISKEEIEQIKVSENSFMPQGLLETLNERERIELFKYLMSL